MIDTASTTQTRPTPRRILAAALATTLVASISALGAGATVGADDRGTTPGSTVSAALPAEATTTTTVPVAPPTVPPTTNRPAPSPTTATTTTPTRPTTTATPKPSPTPGSTPTTTATTAPAATTVATTVPPAPAPAPQNVIAYPDQIAHILATIRYLESRGNYTIPPNKGNASGAYQFIGSTWNNYGGYPAAYLAPPAVQDERAAQDVNRFLAQWNNDVSMIPVMWYYPRASRDVALMDIVPVPSAGNMLTVREYQQRWLGVWAFISGQPLPQAPVSLEQSVSRLGVPPTVPTVEPLAAAAGTDPAVDAIADADGAVDDQRLAAVAFPVLGPTRVAAPECGAAEHSQDAGAEATLAEVDAETEAAGLCASVAPGIVFGVKLQPVLAPVDGVVTDVVDEDTVDESTISVTITDVDGRSYRLAGFNDDNPGTDDGAAPAHLRLTSLARVGSTVRAGQVVGFMGDTDPLPVGVRADVPTDATIDISADDVAPHIRLTIRDIDGTPVDAYGPIVDALFRQVCSVGTGPWSAPPNGSGHEPVTIETTDTDREIDSEWVITSTGQVVASGWAALIYPNETCGYTPPEKRGPGAGGTGEVPATWFEAIDLPTSMWIDLALRPDRTTSELTPPLPVFRR